MVKLRNLDKGLKISIITIIISIIVLASLGFMIKKYDSPILFDTGIMEYVHSRITEFGQNFMKAVTTLGSVKFIIFITLALSIYFYRKKDYEKLIFLLLATVGTSAINQVLKHIFTRTRPEMYFLIEETGYSFPSGHAMISMAFYTSMFYLLRNKFFDNKGIFLALNILIVFLVGFSRIYLGVHWPTDILTGYLVAYAWYRLARHIYEYLVDKDYFKEKFRKKASND